MFHNQSEQLEPCLILRPLGCYLLILWIIGTCLNGSVLIIFIRCKKLRQTSTNIFIGGLLLADFFGACFEIPLPAFSLLSCKWLFTYVGCVIEAVIAYFAGCSNMYMLCLISIDRYIVVTKSFSSTIITVKQTYIAIACAYSFALFWTILPVIGWSTYDYEGTGASCSIKWEDRSFNVISYNITILIFVYLIPVIIIVVTNLKVFLMIRQRRRCTDVNLNESHARRQYLIECRLANTVFFIIGGFLLAWTPYAIAVLVQICVDPNVFPPILGTLPAIFAKTSVVWNPLIYVVRNRNFRFYLQCCADSRRRDQSSRRFSRQVRFVRQRSLLGKDSDPTRYSIYPYSTVQLPLPSARPSVRDL